MSSSSSSRSRKPRRPRRKRTDHARRVLFAYPQVYQACHQHHPRGEWSGDELTDRESSLLAHLDPTSPTSPRKLARHLGITAGTLSVVVDALAERGFLRRVRREDDRRRVDLLLAPRGVTALEGSSVLDKARVQRALQRLSPADRERAVEGLELLAKACLDLDHGHTHT